ncbi:MAG: hypothetical protein KDI36_02820 [Pseudomonadales bacterium]|nr:hypothetical protein [Pseudomonadales bacterium]
MIIHDTLKGIGLNQREIDIYLTLLKLGPVSIRDIAEASGINRGTTYETLKSLRELSLVSYFPKGKRRFFCAEPPDQLLRMAEEKKQRLDIHHRVLESQVIPDLMQLTPGGDSTHVRHYEGDDGIEFVLRDILRTAQHNPEQGYCVYSSKKIRKYLYRPFPNFTRQRVQQGIYVRVIAIGEGGEDAPLSSRKWLPTTQSDPAASYVAIYPPKCAMISLVRDDYPTAVIIEAEAIARSFQLTFDALWDKL